MDKQVYFRADANSKIGMGHLVRLLALASMVKDAYNCDFLVRSPSKEISEIVINSGFNLVIISKDLSLAEELSFIKRSSTANSIVFIDGYDFDESYFQELKSWFSSVIYVDDFGYSNSYIDLIINHAIGFDAGKYLHQNVKLCLGESYCILRPTFLSLAKSYKTIDYIRDIFICFGGSDDSNNTLKAVQAFNKIDHIAVHVVMAPTFPFEQELMQFIESSRQKVSVYKNLNEKEMADLMNKCQLAVAPASNLSYEICAVKMAFIGGYTVDNQQGIHDGLNRNGCLLSLGDMNKAKKEDYTKAILTILDSSEQVEQMILNQQAMFNGSSSKNIREALDLLA